jgi:hypothetical protein
LEPGCAHKLPVITIVEMMAKEGDSPVLAGGKMSTPGQESGCLGLQSKVGGKLHLRLNTDERPIANKYREGKMKRTLKKESKVREIADREAIGMAEPGVHSAWWLVKFNLGQNACRTLHLDSCSALVCRHLLADLLECPNCAILNDPS